MYGSIPLGLTLKGFDDSNNTDYVPGVAEVVINTDTHELKIGDGKTKISDLPYVHATTGVDLATPEPSKFKPSNDAKEVIKKHKELIASNNFDEFYKQLEWELTHILIIRDVTKTLLEAGIDIKSHLTTVPRCIQDMLLGKPEVFDCQIEDFTPYTMSEINAKLHELTEAVKTKIYNATKIPAHLITGEN